jgi:hypothetical protein
MTAPKRVMICKFCGNDKKLMKAHIIPEGFFRRLRRSPESLKLITNRAGEYEKDAPIGVYDKGIVCSDCERIWATWDAYAQLLLAERPLNSQVRYRGGKAIAYIIREFDYDKLKLFFISMLWRASVSTQPFFSKIELGDMERIARQHVSDANPGDTEDFAVALAKFDDPLADVMLDPHGEEISGVRYCRFYLADYVAYIKVDQKRCPPPFSDFSLSRTKPLVVVSRDFRKSNELPLIRELLGGQ